MDRRTGVGSLVLRAEMRDAVEPAVRRSDGPDIPAENGEGKGKDDARSQAQYYLSDNSHCSESGALLQFQGQALEQPATGRSARREYWMRC